MAFIDPLVGPSGTGNAWDNRRTFDALQKQLSTNTIRVFTSAADRDQVITAPKDGQVIYMNTGDATEGLYTYNGSAWMPSGGTTGWVSWTPAIFGSTTSPTLGTGAIQEGFYFQVGKLVVAQAYVVFGTSGVNAGSGEYAMTLPVAPDVATNRNMPSGTVYALDSSANATLAAGMVMVHSTNYTNRARFYYTSAYPTGTLTSLGATTPWTWAASDQIRAFFVYRAA